MLEEMNNGKAPQNKAKAMKKLDTWVHDKGIKMDVQGTA
jgi:hypothetical protein